MSDLAVCTIMSKNYLSFAKTLVDSFLKHNKDGRVFALLTDRLDGYFRPQDEKFTLIELEELRDQIPDFDKFCFQYTRLELNTAVKPFFLEYLFKNYGLKKLVYFDPDILITNKLSDLFNLLDKYSLIITPHLTAPIEDNFKPGEIDVLRSGTYNMGFLALSNTPTTMAFLPWWQKRLYNQCVYAVERGLFVDQKWVDLIPGFFDDVLILRHPGYNVAYWNYHCREIHIEKRKIYVNGKPTYFLHFSGFDPENIRAVSKHQNRFTINKLKNMKPIFESYSSQVIANGYKETKNWPYAFDYFNNGVKILDFARRTYLEMGQQGLSFGNPFSSTGRNSYFNWLRKSKNTIDIKESGSIGLAKELLFRFRRCRDRRLPLGTGRRTIYQWLIIQMKVLLGIPPQAALGENLTRRYRYLRDRLLPFGTRRRMIYELLLKFLKTIHTPEVSISPLHRSSTSSTPVLFLKKEVRSVNFGPILIEHHEPCLMPTPETTNLEKINPDDIKKILIIKLDHLGDVILSLPAVKLVRNIFPQAHVTMMVGPWAKPIVQQVSDVDEIITFALASEKSSEPVRMLSLKEKTEVSQWLGDLRFDLALDFRRHPETREILKLSGARYTVGYATTPNGENDTWISICLPLTPAIADKIGQVIKPHITAQLCQLVQAIPLTLSPSISSIPLVSLNCTDSNRRIIEMFNSLQKDSYVVGIHPGVGSPARQWSVSHFARLGDLFIERNKATVIFFGGRLDLEIVEKICDQMKYKDQAICLAGKFSLKEFLAAVKFCHLFVGNVSGPMHMAAVQGTPTLGIWAGAVTPYEWHPLGLKTMVIRRVINCAPCNIATLEQCPNELKCLKMLWPEKVWEAAQRLLDFSQITFK